MIWSCTETTPKSDDLLTSVFDTSEYLDQILTSGDSIYSVTKTTVYNSEKTSSEIVDYDITPDLQILKKININNPNWLHKYTLNTEMTANGKIMTYRSMDEELKISEFQTTLNALDDVVAFEASIDRNALISSGTRTVKFELNQGYSIIDKSSSLFGDEKEFGIEVVFKQN